MSRFSPLVVFLVLVTTGCSSGPKSSDGAGGVTRADELRDVGGLVATHTAKGRKAAPTPAELASYEQGFPLGVKVIRSGEIVAVWGTAPTPEGDVAAGKGGAELIAYEKKAPAEGGWVLLQNGAVKEMTADEFKTAPKAK